MYILVAYLRLWADQSFPRFPAFSARTSIFPNGSRHSPPARSLSFPSSVRQNYSVFLTPSFFLSSHQCNSVRLHHLVKQLAYHWIVYLASWPLYLQSQVNTVISTSILNVVGLCKFVQPLHSKSSCLYLIPDLWNAPSWQVKATAIVYQRVGPID